MQCFLYNGWQLWWVYTSRWRWRWRILNCFLERCTSWTERKGDFIDLPGVEAAFLAYNQHAEQKRKIMPPEASQALPAAFLLTLHSLILRCNNGRVSVRSSLELDFKCQNKMGVLATPRIIRRSLWSRRCFVGERKELFTDVGQVVQLQHMELLEQSAMTWRVNLQPADSLKLMCGEYFNERENAAEVGFSWCQVYLRCKLYS